jgi:hypothetical protein
MKIQLIAILVWTVFYLCPVSCKQRSPINMTAFMEAVENESRVPFEGRKIEEKRMK